MSTAGNRPRSRLLNVWVDNLSMAELMAALDQGIVWTLNPDHVYHLQRNRDFYDAYQQADFITSDKTLVFKGSAAANATVLLTLTGPSGGFSNVSVTANAAGEWSYDHGATALSDGSYTLQAASGTGKKQRSGLLEIHLVKPQAGLLEHQRIAFGRVDGAADVKGCNVS